MNFREGRRLKAIYLKLEMTIRDLKEGVPDPTINRIDLAAERLEDIKSHIGVMICELEDSMKE